MAQCMLTTFDNPYNPFDDFTKWWLWDVTHGYNSCALLARVSGNKDELTDEEQSASIEKAIDSIIDCDFFHVYKKVKNESSDSKKIVAQTKEKEKEAVPA